LIDLDFIVLESWQTPVSVQPFVKLPIGAKMLLDIDDARDVARFPASFYTLAASHRRPENGAEPVV
jgi:hypothetical protein